jgi:hypothetical protein
VPRQISSLEIIGDFDPPAGCIADVRRYAVSPQENGGRAVLLPSVSLPPPKTDSDAFAKIADILELPLTLRQRAIERIHASKKQRHPEAR